MQYKQLFKEIGIYGVGDILLKATSFITLPIYTRLFSPEDYGVWSYVATTVGFAGGILALGADSAYARYFFDAKSEQEKQVVTSTWLSFLAVWNIAAVLLCLPFMNGYAHWSFGRADYGILFVLALLAWPVQLINQLCGQVLRNQFRATLFTTLNSVTTLLTITFNLLGVAVLKLGLVGFFGGALAAALLMLPIRLWTARALLRPVFSWGTLRQLLAYGIPLVPTSVAYWIFLTSDRMVLGKLSTLEQAGLYMVANGVTSNLAYVNSALGQAWAPHAMQMFEEQKEYAPIFYGRMMTYILLGFGCLCVAVTTFAHEGLVILSTPPFYPAAAAVGPLAFGFVALASTQVSALGISLTKKTYYLLIFSWLAALLNLGLNLWWIPRWGMLAASWSTAISYVFLTGSYLFTSQRLLPVVYEKRRAFTIVTVTLCFTVMATYLPTVGLFVDIVIKLFYCVAYGGTLVLLRVFSSSEWQMMRTSVQNLPHYLRRRAV